MNDNFDKNTVFYLRVSVPMHRVMKKLFALDVSSHNLVRSSWHFKRFFRHILEGQFKEAFVDVETGSSDIVEVITIECYDDIIFPDYANEILGDSLQELYESALTSWELSL